MDKKAKDSYGSFASEYRSSGGERIVYTLIRTSGITIRKHRKIIAEANPYLLEFAAYFYRRRHYKESKTLKGFTSREMRLNYGYDN